MEKKRLRDRMEMTWTWSWKWKITTNTKMDLSGFKRQLKWIKCSSIFVYSSPSFLKIQKRLQERLFSIHSSHSNMEIDWSCAMGNVVLIIISISNVELTVQQKYISCQSGRREMINVSFFTWHPNPLIIQETLLVW